VSITVPIGTVSADLSSMKSRARGMRISTVPLTGASRTVLAKTGADA
jgi:hypothetical protein